MSWDKVYLDTRLDGDMCCVSDYETYANWVYYNHPELVTLKPLYNTSLSRKHLSNLSNLERSYKSKYKSVSFHSYIDTNLKNI